MGQLSTYEPESLTDVEALIAAHGNAFDSYSLLLFAQGQLQTIPTASAPRRTPTFRPSSPTCCCR